MSVKMIASWGSSGAGKSTIAVSLAAQLARRKKNVVIISTDTKTPALPVFLPTVTQLGPNNSIGTAFQNKQINKDTLKGRIHIHPKSDRISFIGMVSGEIATFTYKAIESESLVELLQLLQNSPYDYVIFDCDSNPVFDADCSYWLLRSTTGRKPDVRKGEVKMFEKIKYFFQPCRRYGDSRIIFKISKQKMFSFRNGWKY